MSKPLPKLFKYVPTFSPTYRPNIPPNISPNLPKSSLTFLRCQVFFLGGGTGCRILINTSEIDLPEVFFIFGDQIFGQIFDQVFDEGFGQVFGQVFGQIFDQGFDQGFWPQ